MKKIIQGFASLVLVVVVGAAHASTEWNAQEYDLYSGDFNGDGYADILYVAKDPSMPSGIALSDASGVAHIAWQSWASNFLGINWSGNAYNVVIGDFNGDGKSDILLQSAAPGNSYLLLTSGAGTVTGISQTIANSTMGLTWSADQHKIIAGAFSTQGAHLKYGLFLQATSSTGIDAVVLTDGNGQFTATTPNQTWTDGFSGLNWSTQSANVFAGNFNANAYGIASLLVQAKPRFVTINYDVPFPIPTYNPNLNGVVVATSASLGNGNVYSNFAATGAQLWSRMNNGVDWSPLTNTVVVVTTSTGSSTVILQGRYSGRSSYELIGNVAGAIFPGTATTLTSNVGMTADGYKLVAGNFGKTTTGGLYFEAMSPGGANFSTASIGSTGSIVASTQNPTTVMGTVEATSAGRTAGQFAITPTGAVTYNIPIWTPSGARDIEPHLALHYISGGPDGIMGPGWSLTGLSAIVRCGKTWASTGGTATQVGSPAGVTLATNDDLCIDGNRLRLTSGTQGMGGSTYMTELADFSLVTANGVSTAAATSFTVQGKDGHYYEYGNTTTSANSQVTAAGSMAPYVWAIDQVSDRQGNRMVYLYNPSSTTVNLNTIQYTATAAAANTFYYTVKFNYLSSRTGGTTLTKYVAGGTVTQSQQLASIQVSSLNPSSLVRQYNLGYSSSPTTGRPLLTAIQECGIGGSDCIRPTTFTYQPGAAGWSPNSTATGLSGQYGFLPLDLNGDGIPDALYGKLSGSTITWYARIGTSGGYGAEIATGATTSATSTAPTLIPGSFTGKGGSQFIAAIGTVWKLFAYTAGTFSVTSTGVNVNGEMSAVDYDGDGLSDLVSYNAPSSLLVRRNITAPGASVSFASSPTLIYTFTGAFAYKAGSQVPVIADFNGDGRGDFLFNDTICGKACHYQSLEILSNGFGSLATAVTIPQLDIIGVPGDWNGDGCTDMISPTVIYVSDCVGGFAQVITTAAPNTAVSAMAVDVDGDGQTDLVYTDTATHNLYLIRSTGNGAAAPVPLNIAAPNTASFFTMDSNADGQPEIGVIDSANGYAVSYYLHNGSSAPPDLVSGVTDGFGINFSPTYVSISQSGIYTKGSAAVFPDEDLQAPMYVVNQFTASDGTGGTYQTSFTYSGARLNLQGRGFEGFTTTTAIDNRNALVHSIAYYQAFPNTGAVAEDDVYQSGGTIPISKTTNVNLSKTVVGSASISTCSTCFFPYVDNINVNRYEISPSKNGAYVSNTYTKYVYDAYGTLTSTTVTVTDEDAASPVSPYLNQQWITNITNVIYNNDSPSVWCLGRPTSTITTKTAANQPTLSRTVFHTMDATAGGQSNAAYGNCRATAEIVEPNSSTLKLTTNFGFDSCGNTNSVSVIGLDETGAPMPARTTVTNYNYYGLQYSRCQYPEAVTNPYAQTSSVIYRYDIGQKQSVTDPNGVSVNWTYDDFGRKTRENRPDSTATKWAYIDCVAVSCWGTSDVRFQMTETLLDSAGSTVRMHEVFTDGLDRVRFDEGNRVLGAWNTQVIQYDSLGRKLNVYLPYSSSSNGYHSYTYDVGNRPLTDTLFTSTGSQYRQIQMAYSGDTSTVKDPKQITTTRITDAVGKLRDIMDPQDGVSSLPAGHTQYTYDSFDNLVTIVDPIGATSTYTYNIRGFKTKSVGADTGTWSFTPDSLDELKIQVDANGSTTKYTYDLLGRMLTRLEPESTTPTSWVYGTNASLHEIGQLNSVTKPDGYAESNAYDNLGRPLTKKYTEDGTVYQFDYAYNSIGAPDTLTYPISTSGVRFSLKYNYDSTGYLNSVNDASAGTVFWTLTGANDNSAPTMEVLGNSVSVATAYTPWTNEMVSRTEGAAGSTTNLQNLSYSWDINGNLLQRIDNRQGLSEAFTLDNLNRLSTVTLNGAQTLSVRYDQAGDITNKSDMGAYTYGNSAHPHAVTSAGGWSVGYDANGNMNARAGGSITSYSYNLPNTINYNGNSSQFNYDSNHQRWKQVASYAGTIETTHYIGGLLQVVTRGTNPTEYRHQIPAGSSTAVYTRRTDGSTNTYYATSDHLGSADLVMDSAANVLVRESYTPFGARRGTNWQNTPSLGDYTAIQNTTRQGFTGHEMLDAVGLVHMTGRVYDPTLGRFLSTDSVIQSLGASQSINPYSYAWNDPLRYLDPGGHSLLGAILGVIATVLITTFAPELLLPALQGSFGWITAGIAGFVGGFVGAVVSTGSFSTALTAGLIGGLTGAAFFGAGTFSKWAANKSSTWLAIDGALSHAAVGCASAVASGGNCGKGALSAAIAQAAAPLERSAAIWGGPGAGTAAAGIVGGAAARAIGSSFSEGFTIGAAGYLFNDTAHQLAQSQSGTAQSGVSPANFMSNKALNPGFFVPGTYSPDPGAVQSVLGPESLPLLLGLSPAFAAEGAVSEGTTLFRVFGDEAQGLGQSWTTVNPGTVANYRDVAGLFPGNSGQFVIEGTLEDTTGVLFRPALPGPGGIGGGLPEVVVPNPGGQICIVCVSGANPPF